MACKNCMIGALGVANLQGTMTMEQEAIFHFVKNYKCHSYANTMPRWVKWLLEGDGYMACFYTFTAWWAVSP